jgi:O-antigen/teichoic acid export membrane protein
MKNINQIKVGSLLSYLQMLLGILVTLIYTPIMLRTLGQSEYGLYNTVASTISMLSILNLGFNSGYIRYFAKYKKANDTESIWKLNGLFLIIFAIIGAVALVCGFFLSFNLQFVFSDGLTPSEYSLAKTLTIILSINLAISFPMSVFTHIISANEKFVFLKLISVIKTVLNPLVTLPLLLMGFRSVAMVTVTLIFSVLTDAIFMYYVLHRLKYKFVFRNFEKGIFKSLFTYTSFIAINIIVDQINWNVDKILLGRFRGTEMVAVYSVGYTLYQYYMMFSTSISSVFTPKIHRIVSETSDNQIEQRERLSEIFVKVGRIQFIILGLIASGFLFFGKDFITKYWAGSKYGESYYVALLLFFSASIALIQNLGIEIQRAQDKHKFRAFVYFGMALINVAITIVLCQKYGAIGSAIGTAISLILANGLVMNIYYHFCCNINIILFWKNIIRLSLGLVLPVICGIYINKCFALLNIWQYLAAIAVYMGVYCISMWFVGMNSYEHELLLKPVKKVVKKHDRSHKQK